MKLDLILIHSWEVIYNDTQLEKEGRDEAVPWQCPGKREEVLCHPCQT